MKKFLFLYLQPSPHKTFLEKLFLLHEEFYRPDKSTIRSFRMSRHLYDISRMLNAGIDKEALADTGLYKTLVKHREQYIRISWMDYETLTASVINFIPPDEVIDTYRKDYEVMKEQMIYGDAEEFDDLMQALKEFLSFLRK
jgi:hypothetical protein